MKVIEVHEIPEGGNHTEGIRVHVPRGTGFHIQDERSNPLHGGIVMSDLALELNHLTEIAFFLKGNTEGEIEVAEDLVLFKLYQGLEKSTVGISEAFMGLSQPI